MRIVNKFRVPWETWTHPYVLSWPSDYNQATVIQTVKSDAIGRSERSVLELLLPTKMEWHGSD